MSIEIIKESAMDTFSRLMEADKGLSRILKKINEGNNVGFLDANNYAEKLGGVLKRTLDSVITEYGEEALGILDSFVDEVIGPMYRGNSRLATAISKSIGEDLYIASDINLGLISPDIDVDRIAKISANTKKASTVEKLRSASTIDAISFTMAAVDSFIKTNADFMGEMGYDSVIRRKWDRTEPTSHDTRHTDWCSKLQGTFNYKSASRQGDYARKSGHTHQYGSGDHYTDAPKNVFVRHENCKCTVEWIPLGGGKARKTALAKGEKDTDNELWNTGKEFSQSRKAVLRRRRERLGPEEARRILNEEWKGGRNGLAERHFK